MGQSDEFGFWRQRRKSSRDEKVQRGWVLSAGHRAAEFREEGLVQARRGTIA